MGRNPGSLLVIPAQAGIQCRFYYCEAQAAAAITPRLQDPENIVALSGKSCYEGTVSENALEKLPFRIAAP